MMLDCPKATEEEKQKIKEGECDVCGQSFSSIEELFAHNREMNHGRWPGFWKPNVCDICGYQYQGQYDQMSHKKRKHYVERHLTCFDCGKTFSRKDHVKSHMLYAHAPYPPKYTCDECDKDFKQNQHLTRHIEEVHKGRYFECKSCKTTFSREDKLNKHEKKCVATKNV